MQNVVEPFELTRFLNDKNVLRLLDHTYYFTITARIRANCTHLVFRNGPAGLAEFHFLVECVEQVGKALRLGNISPKQMKCYALRALAADSGETNLRARFAVES